MSSVTGVPTLPDSIYCSCSSFSSTASSGTACDISSSHYLWDVMPVQQLGKHQETPTRYSFRFVCICIFFPKWIVTR
ncbi:rCG37217 [Rattus norvegicus]|uniref:RCG37217 n=1 Tax=Rattus norvegicus TaxID=10116 RepID=A6HUI6_RAT|nr:rCG37217 [Rattus norvegicus]